MLSEVIGNMGLVNFALLIVGLSLLVVIILFMSYFRTLVTIANYAYPNAKFRAKGTPFVKKENLDTFLDIRNFNEVVSQLKEEGYDIPKDSSQDVEKLSELIEKMMLDDLKNAKETAPEKVKPFVKSWLLKYDIKMVKKAIKGINKGLDKDEIRKRMYPINIIDEGLIDEIAEANSIPELINIIKETKIGEVIEERELEDNFFLLDIKLDRYAVEEIKKTVLKSETEDQPALNYFVGKYIDLTNLKIIFRGLNEDVDKNQLKKALISGGRELPSWKLENMSESESIDEAIVELEGTSYSNIKKESLSKGLFELELSIDQQLLKTTSSITNENILTIGPLLKFLIGKEIELRNIRVLLRGITEGIKPENIRKMMIMEE